MQENLTQIVVEKMQNLSTEKQREVADFVNKLAEIATPKKKSLLDKLDEISSRVPVEMWEKLPIDGAEQHDHYLYGTPKR
jgi:hypothetical protein